MRPRFALLLAAVAVAGCGGAGAVEQESPRGPVAVVEGLRSGGLVIFLRHAETERSQQDVLGAPIGDCASQRNLNEAGREQAREIGEAAAALEIPVGPVLSSEYCRCLETARLAFDRVVPDPDLTGLSNPDEPAERRRRIEALRVLLSEPAGSSNRVVVGHVKSLEAAAGLEVKEGESAVFEPLGEGEFRLVGRIPASAWRQLADALAGS